MICTYVDHGGKRYFVSTINRDSSSCEPHRYAETIVWEWDEKKKERGDIVMQGSALENSIFRHQKIVEQIHANGIPTGEDNED